MIASSQKTSLLVPYQLPEYLRDDPNYVNFVSFIQAYYQWLEQNGNVLDYSKNILTYQDIDTAPTNFLQYYVNEFLQYFPQDPNAIPVSQNLLIKFAKEIYLSKGSHPAYYFLFRALYNSDFDMFHTRDVVFKASSGTWYVAKSLKLLSLDTNLLNIANFRVFGETTKSIATIENSIVSGNKIEVFISNIERLFQSGEYVRVVDNRNQDLYFLNGQVVSSNTAGAEILRAKIVGQLSQVNIDPNNRGLFYKPGDPVVIYGGLNAPTGVGGTAQVGTTTAGGVKRVNVVNGGFGYRVDPYTQIQFGNLNTGAVSPSANVSSITPTLLPIISINSPGVGYNLNDPVYTIINSNPYNFAYVSSVDNNGGILQIAYNYGVSSNGVIGVSANVASTNTAAYGASINVANSAGSAIANVTYAPINTIGFAKNTKIGNTSYSFLQANPSANANTTLANSLSFISFSTYPISSISMLNEGGGITRAPSVSALSVYDTDQNGYAYLNSLGILAPIQILEGGSGYKINDTIQFIGGSGYGAYANVTSVDINGSITGITYIQNNIVLPLGGMGYQYVLPTLNVISNTGSNASIEVTGILGSGASFSVVTDRAGSITTIDVTNYGEDYVSTPNVSLRVQDIVVTGLDVTKSPLIGDFIYQGSSGNNAIYEAYVYSYDILQQDVNPLNSLYVLRVYDYSSNPNSNLPFNIDRNNIILHECSPDNILLPSGTNIVTNYGDGSAKATASFLNGLVVGQGQYITTQGQPSSFNVLQGGKYNNYTYQITVQKEIAVYRDILLNLLHPAGTQVFGRYAMESENNFDYTPQSALFTGKPLSYFTPGYDSTVFMTSNLTNKSSNTVYFNIDGANLANIITSTGNSIIEITPTHGPLVRCEIESVNYTTNTITLHNSTWLTFGNVAFVKANSGSNVINITALTGAFDIVNNGNYSNTANPLEDIVYAGDTIYFNEFIVQNIVSEGSNSQPFLTEDGNNILSEEFICKVTHVDYVNQNIYVSTLLPQISNSLIAVERTFGPTSCVRIYGPVGTQYIAEITTEDGYIITTEDLKSLILG